MSADPIVYCLERVSDYREFERLCSALLAGVGYPGLDPLGGTGDEGRDAFIRSDEAGRTVAFAYSVRTDWLTKLQADCDRVRAKNHSPDIFVFVCTESLSASQKDSAYALVANRYGWKLDLFDLERLRVQLANPQRHLVAQHPSIFTPPFFVRRGGELIAESRDTLLIDHAPCDHAIATWLAHRLSLAGYRTWCYGTAPLAGEDADETVRVLLVSRAQLYLPLISTTSISEGTFRERCTIAAAKDDFVLPCRCGDVSDSELPSRLAKLVPADFRRSLRLGMEQVLARLNELGIQPSLDSDRGRRIALGDYLPARVTFAKPEPVFANVFPLQIPKSLLTIETSRQLTEAEILDLRKRWAFAELSAYELVAFTPPPSEIAPQFEVHRGAEFAWDVNLYRSGRKTIDLARELAWRSLQVICTQKGLQYCNNRKVFYFPASRTEEWNQTIRHVDGRLTTVQLTGKRTKGWGDRASPFLYQLAPKFLPWHDTDGTWNVVVKIYIRVTTTEGGLFEEKEIGRRRKIVSKSWWNKEWLARLLGVVQALETSKGRIAIGEGNRAVAMDSTPLSWECPVGIDVLALSGVADIGEEIAQYRTRDDDEADDNQSAIAPLEDVTT